MRRIGIRLSIGLRNARGIRTIRIAEPMERRIPIRRLVYAGAYITGHSGALATMERKLHDFRHVVLVVLTGFLRVNPPFYGGKNQRGVAISVTPRQIINQSLSHFFHNEKSQSLSVCLSII